MMNKLNYKKDILLKKGLYWEKERKKRSLALFYKASKLVPAYKDFLKKSKINPEKIKTWQDFQSVPPISKKNYLREYPLEKLCWDGHLQKPLVYTSTSGSTGTPFYFMRQEDLDWQYSFIIESFIKSRLKKTETPVLVIVCFGMGIWIGGLITYKGYEIFAKRSNCPLSIITPGLNKNEIFKILKQLAPQYKQTILTGYPPFIKDIIDEAPSQGINLKSLNIRLHFAAEAITEQFREYLLDYGGINNLYKDIINIYGSADIGAMAVENALCILIKRLSIKTPQLFQEIFSAANKTPTLAQYNPLFINFEAPNHEILLTSHSALPLVRYSIGDHGGVLSFSEIKAKFKKYDLDLYDEAEKVGIADHIAQLPFVHVYERIDLSTSLYGLLIYPEWMKIALLQKTMSEYLTGKFTMITKFDKKQNQYLEINIEVKKDKKITSVFQKDVLKNIVNTLCLYSSEYKELSERLKQKALPLLKFWPQGDLLHFQSGIKQKWVKKD